MLARSRFDEHWRWFGGPAGQYLREQEMAFLEGLWDQLTGDTLLWIGLDAPQVPERYRVTRALLAEVGPSECVGPETCYVDSSWLPVRDAEFDVVVLQHGIDCASDPYAGLREAARAVRNGGWLLIYGLNPWSALGATRLWGAMPGLSARAHLISPLRMADWLAVLGFHVHRARYLMYRPVQGDWWKHLSFVQRPLQSLPLGTAYALATRRQSHAATPLVPAKRVVRSGRVATASVARTVLRGNVP